jgi:hypothetical protein
MQYIELQFDALQQLGNQIGGFEFLREVVATNSGICSWLRHYTTSRKVAGSSPGPDEVDFFN